MLLSGGTCVLDTQDVSDIDINIRKSCSQNFYIHHLNKMFILPFVVMYVQEMLYSESGLVINTMSTDVEDNLKKILIPKKYFKYYDQYCYSALTDDLPYTSTKVVPTSLKAEYIVSFRDFKGVKKNAKKDIE